MANVEAPQSARTILMTGGSRGIGAALATAACAEGHRVAINYRSNAAEAEELAERLSDGPGEAFVVQADVTDPNEVDRLLAKAIDRFGRLDCVVNNAGVGKVVDLADVDLVSFEDTIKANLVSAFLVSQAAWPLMREAGGRLIFMSSAAARSGGRLSAAYAASKGGIEGLMHAYASSLRPYRITANALAPALIESRMTDEMDLGNPEKLPMGRLGRPEELWPAVRMILETEYLTGQTIHIDAGRYPT